MSPGQVSPHHPRPEEKGPDCRLKPVGPVTVQPGSYVGLWSQGSWRLRSICLLGDLSRRKTGLQNLCVSGFEHQSPWVPLLLQVDYFWCWLGWVMILISILGKCCSLATLWWVCANAQKACWIVLVTALTTHPPNSKFNLWWRPRRCLHCLS